MNNLKMKSLKHQKISYSLRTSIKLFLENLMFCFCKKKTKLQKLYVIGQEKLETELNVVKIIRNMKNLRILMKSLSEEL